MTVADSSSYMLVAAVLGIFHLCEASNGDSSYIFRKCVNGCFRENCTDINVFEVSQPTHMKLLLWSCKDECKYQCMWTTVDAFHRDGSHVPQFYGKWPFVRYGGIQEPASMIFSLLNAISHLAIFYYRAKVSSSTPMYNVWHGMSMVGIITWLCAAVFHTRDTLITEQPMFRAEEFSSGRESLRWSDSLPDENSLALNMARSDTIRAGTQKRMDYFSAFALVLFNLFSLLCRAIGTNHRKILTVIGCLLIGFYIYHIHFLAFVHFDYGYNMKVNVAVGAINGTGWIAWWFYHRKTRPYAWKAALVMVGLIALLMLELGDFPPWMWTLDAHAMWHAGTVPLNLLWYSFIIDDAQEEKVPEKNADVKKMV